MIDTATSTATNVLYYPTPLEQAYSLYLGQQVFHISPNQPLHIAGRSAVPFLTQSGVNRGTLRSIWTATDPQNIGTLLQWTQFQLMLRLVSMAQAGILNAEGTPDSMREAVQQYAGQLLALPVFSSAVIPPHDNLLAMYGMFVITYPATTQASAAPMGAGDGSVSSSPGVLGQVSAPDTTNMGFGNSSSPGMMIPPSYYGMQGVAAANSFGAASTVSVDDAFSDLGPTTNAPLPSLGDVISVDSLPLAPTNSNDTGETETELPPPTAALSSAGDGGSLAEGSMISGTSIPSELFTTTTLPVASDPGMVMPAPAAAAGTDTEEDDDEFGDFEEGTPSYSAPPAAAMAGGHSDQSTPQRGMEMLSAASTAAAGSSSSVVSDDPFGAFGETSNQPLPSLEAASSFAADPSGTTSSAEDPHVEANIEDDDFGDFSAATPPAPSVPDQQFGIAHHQAPPSTTMASHSFDGSVQSSSMAAMTLANVQQSGAEQDDFGGFNAAPAAVQDQFGADCSDENGDDDGGGFGGFEAAAAAPSNQESSSIPDGTSSSDPFSGMPEIPNQALPQLGSFDQPYQSSNMASPSFDGSVQSASMAPITTSVPQFAADHDDFGGFSAAAAPVEDRCRAGNSDNDDDDDDFGGFETATVPSNPENSSIPDDPSSSDPFSEIPEIPNQPLPQLGSFDQALESTMTLPSFDGSNPSEATAPATANHLSQSAAEQDDFGEFSASPGPAQDQFGADKNDHNDDDDDFGGFEAAAAPSDQESSSIPDGPSSNDPFSGMPEIPNQPLPQMGSFNLTPECSTMASPSFDGSVQSASMAPGTLSVPQSGADQADFGGFDANHNTNDDDDFGGFETATVPSNQESSSVPDGSSSSDPFSEIPEIRNQPLPQLGAFDQALESTMTLPSFDGSNPSAAMAPATTNHLSQSAAEQDDFGEFSASPGPAQDQFGADKNDHNDNDDDDDFGGFEAAAAPSDQESSSIPDGPSSSDPFSGMPEIPNQPLPQMGSFGRALESTMTLPSFDESNPSASMTATATDNLSTETDLFGSFDAAPSQAATVDDPTSGEDAEFGDFDTAPAAEAPVTEEDLFGSFDAAPSQAATLPDPKSAGVDDDFGAFDSAPAAKASTIEEDLFGSFDAAPSQAATVPDSTSVGEDDDFGDFGAAPAVEALAIEEDLFGSFDAAPSQGPAVVPDSTSTGKDDGFGDFGAAPAAEASTTGEDSFGTFDAAPSQAATVPDPTSAGEDDNFGAFDAAFPTETSPSGEDQFGSATGHVPLSIEDQIRDMSAPLLENLLRKSGFAGGHVDLVECFEANIGSSNMDAAKKNRVDRCIQVLEILSKVNHNHSSTFWEQVLKVVRDELLHCSNILVEARRLSATELSEVTQPLESMIAALREYTRVSRSIVATIGDIMMLEPSALLTIDTFASTWCSLSMLEVALEIESKWKDILREVKLMLPSFSRFADAPTLEEIRSSVSGKFPPGNICELTFQPLLPRYKSSTQAKVSWNGKEFMACSANLLANRCPFYVATNGK